MTGIILFSGVVITFTLAFLTILSATERNSNRKLDFEDAGICALQAMLVALFWPLTLPLGVMGLLCWSIFTKFISKNRNKANG